MRTVEEDGLCLSAPANRPGTPVVPLEYRVIALEKRVAILTDWLLKLTHTLAEDE